MLCQLSYDPHILAGMTRLELANQLIENQPAFHFAFIPMVRVERFELVTKLVLSQPPLPIVLHARDLECADLSALEKSGD